MAFEGCVMFRDCLTLKVCLAFMPRGCVTFEGGVCDVYGVSDV